MSRIVDFFKNLTAPGQEELNQKEVILNDDSLTTEQKKELIKTIENKDLEAKKLWSYNIKVEKNKKLETQVVPKRNYGKGNLSKQNQNSRQNNERV